MGSIHPRTSAADNVRKLAPKAPPPKTAAAGTGRALAQSPKAKGNDAALPVAVARQLAYGSDADRLQLRSIVEQLSPQARENLMTSIASQTRDPRSPAKAISLTPEGQELVGIIFNGDSPSPERLAEIANVGDVSAPRLADVELGEDLSPKPPPPPPKGSGGKKPKDHTRFRSTESVVPGKEDGTLRVKHSDVQLDRQTKTAIDRAKKGERAGPIYDDPTNTPRGAPPGGALRSGARTPLQEYTQQLNRLAGLRDPSQGTHAGSVVSDEVGAGVPMSAFMPRIPSSPAGGSMATVRPQDYADAMRLFQFTRKGSNRVPNTQYASAEEMARDLVSRGHQGGYDATPVTPGQRRAATDMLEDASYDPEGAPVTYGRGLAGGDVPPGQLTEAAAGRMVRQNMPAEAKAASVAERAVVQEQVIESLARKLDEIFGHEGWGADYQPSARPASSDPAAPPGGVGEGVASSGYEPAGVPPKNPGLAGRPGTEFDPELDMEDLDNLDAVRRSAGEGAPIPGGEAESVVTTGRKQGDKVGVTPSKAREEGGHRPGAYEDPEASFAEFNKLNRKPSAEDLARRQSFFDQWSRAVEMDSSPTAQLRRELKAILDSEEPIAPGTRVDTARLDKIADLQRRIALADRLDQMSGIHTMQPDEPQLPAIVRRDPFDMNGRPHNPADEIIDAEFELVPNRTPDATPAATPDPAPAAAARPNWWRRIGGLTGSAIGIGLGYSALRRAGEPPVPPGGYGGGTEGMAGEGGYPPYLPTEKPRTAAERIRMLQDRPMILNPNTQIMQNWIQ